MLQRVVALAGRNVPDLDGEIARGRGEDVFGRGVEEDLSDFPIAVIRIVKLMGEAGNQLS